MNIDLDLLRQELNAAVAAAPREPLITPSDIRRATRPRAGRIIAWSAAACVAALVATAISLHLQASRWQYDGAPIATAQYSRVVSNADAAHVDKAAALIMSSLQKGALQ